MSRNAQTHSPIADAVHRPARGMPAGLDTSWSSKLSDLKVTDTIHNTSPVPNILMIFFSAVLEVTYDVLQGPPHILRTCWKQNTVNRLLLRLLFIPGQPVWGLWWQKRQALGHDFQLLVTGATVLISKHGEAKRLFSSPTTSRPFREPTQPHIQRVQMFFSRSKAAETSS